MKRTKTKIKMGSKRSWDRQEGAFFGTFFLFLQSLYTYTHIPLSFFYFSSSVFFPSCRNNAHGLISISHLFLFPYFSICFLFSVLSWDFRYPSVSPISRSLSFSPKSDIPVSLCLFLFLSSYTFSFSDPFYFSVHRMLYIECYQGWTCQIVRGSQGQ